MKNILVILLITVFSTACSDKPADSEKYCITPELANAKRLDSHDISNGIVKTVLAELSSTKENSSEFYLSIETSSTETQAHLWHRDSFKPENCGLAGNPGRVNRTIYISESNRDVKTLWWQ